LTWTLGVIAFVAVMGLVPLWSFVYRTYSTRPTLPSTPVPTPLVTFTPEVQLVSVPNTLGKPREEAQEMLARAGLRFALLEERDEPGVERGIVLEQSPAPDELVPFDTEVSVVVSGSGRELTMPGVVDYPVDLVQDGLESDGLRVAIDRVWSAQPEGMVLKQEPEQGTAVYAGDTVTLTVSGGVDIPIPLEVNLAHLVTLQSAELRQETFPPGGVIAVTLRWRALRSIDAPYVVFVHLIGPSGNLVAQQDKEPLTPTTAWTPGVESVDPHQVTIPRGQPTGLYQLRAGMYPQGQPHYRLPVVDEGLTTAESDSILIAEIEVEP
jgi:serine/threonine-protein kinase